MEELKRTVEGVKLALGELSERLTKAEIELGVLRAGCEVMFHALELNGLLSGGEPAKPVAKPKPEPIATVSEITFTILKWDPQQGAKIGPYDVAYKASNLVDKWTSAFNVLRQSNATIKNRYRGLDYQFSYWLYGEGKIYRQKLKAKP